MTPFVNPEDYWTAQRWVEQAEEAASAPTPTERRQARLTVELYGGICAFCGGDDGDWNLPSLATCEKVPMSASGDEVEPGREGLNHPETVDEAGHISDAMEAIYLSLDRDRERQRTVIAMIQAGEVAHAKRFATCNRRSVQLRCPTLGGGCGCEENYVPMSCDSRLCEDCMRRRQGLVAEQYRNVVSSWDAPTMVRLSLPDRVDTDDLARALDAIRGAFGRLRRRVIPGEGEHQGKRWVWKRDGGDPADHYWKSALLRSGHHEAARRWQKRYVDQGRGIPASEVFREGFYGVDIKQKEDGRLNVHIHVLADIPYLPQAALASVWDDLVGAPVVDIRRVDERGERGRESALMETIGYAAKAPEYVDVDDEVAYLTALKGSKLIQPFGELHGNTPDVTGLLRCGECEMAPAYWEYLGVIDGRHETMLVGPAPDGDRPPPGGES